MKMRSINPAISVRSAADLDADLMTRSLNLRADSIDVQARSIEAILSTDQPVEVFDMNTFRIIRESLVSDGAQFATQVRLLDSHDRSTVESILGSVREFNKSSGRVTGRLFFAKDNQAAENAWNLVQQRHLTDVSVGYISLKWIDLKAGESRSIAGKTYDGGADGLRVTTKWLIKEVSMVPIGADDRAKIRAARETRRQSQGGESNMKLKLLMRLLKKLGLRAGSTNEEASAFYEGLEEGERADLLQRLGLAEEATADEAESALAGMERAARLAIENAFTRSDNSGEAADQDGAGDEEPPAGAAEGQRQEVSQAVALALTEQRRAERARVASIRTLAGDDIPVALLTRAIDEEWTVERASSEFLTAVRSGRSAFAGANVHTRNFQPAEIQRHLGAGLLLRTGIAGMEALAASERRMSDARRREHEQLLDRGQQYADHSLVDLCREICQITGARDPNGGGVPHGRASFIRAAVSSGALTNIFTTSINAQLLLSYQEADDTTDGWTREEDVADFKTNERIGMGKTSGLKKLPRGSEAAHESIGDSKEEYKIARYAKQGVIDEQDIIDDNLNALSEIPVESGLSAARLKPDLVYSILLANGSLSDGVALFHATHGNTATNAFNKANLQAAVTAMSQQKLDNARLNNRAAFLLVNPALEFDARELLYSTQLVVAGVTDTVRGNRNVVADLNLQLRVEGRLDSAGVTDPNSETAYTGSSTMWFLSCSPVTGRTIIVGYLAGTGRRPQLRTFSLTQGQWGVGFDIKHDIGAKALDYRGLYRGNS